MELLDIPAKTDKLSVCNFGVSIFCYDLCMLLFEVWAIKSAGKKKYKQRPPPKKGEASSVGPTLRNPRPWFDMVEGGRNGASDCFGAETGFHRPGRYAITGFRKLGHLK